MNIRLSAVRFSLRMPTAVAVIALAAFSASEATFAQQRGAAPVEQRLARCVAINDSTIRLACFDDVANAVVPTTVAAAPAPNSAPQPARPAPAPGEQVAKPVEPAAAPVVATATESIATAAPAAKQIDKDAAFNISVVQTRKDAVGRWLFFLDNGQVWRQLEKTRVTVPKTLPAAATIASGILGSNNLRFGEKGRAIKVKRLK